MLLNIHSTCKNVVIVKHQILFFSAKYNVWILLMEYIINYTVLAYYYNDYTISSFFIQSVAIIVNYVYIYHIVMSSDYFMHTLPHEINKIKSWFALMIYPQYFVRVRETRGDHNWISDPICLCGVLFDWC